MIKKLNVQTQQKTEVINLTAPLAGLVEEVADGLALFSVPHTTAALLLCEDDEELRADLVRTAEKLLAGLEPFQHRRNDNPNAAAHIVSALAGTGLVLAIEDGKLDLGTYQNILLLELDGPKRREVRCKIIRAG